MTEQRRNALTGLMLVMSLIAMLALIYVFASGLGSSAQKEVPQTLQIDTRFFPVNSYVRADWRDGKILVFRRSAEQQQQLFRLAQVSGLYETDSRQNAKEPQYPNDAVHASPLEFIVFEIDREECVVRHQFEKPASIDVANWLGGFYSPCEDVYFDLSGRLYAEYRERHANSTEDRQKRDVIRDLRLVPFTRRQDGFLIIE